MGPNESQPQFRIERPWWRRGDLQYRRPWGKKIAAWRRGKGPVSRSIRRCLWDSSVAYGTSRARRIQPHTWHHGDHHQEIGGERFLSCSRVSELDGESAMPVRRSRTAKLPRCAVSFCNSVFITIDRDKSSARSAICNPHPSQEQGLHARGVFGVGDWQCRDHSSVYCSERNPDSTTSMC